MPLHKTAFVPYTPVLLNGRPSTHKIAQSSTIGELSENYVYAIVVGTVGDKFNTNWDYYPWTELLSDKWWGVPAYETWVGRPVCRNHNNRGPETHFGEVVDAYPKISTDANQDPLRVIMMVLGVDKNRNRMLASGVAKGYHNSVSMSCSVQVSACSYCGHEVRDEKDQLCQHCTTFRGQWLPVRRDMDHYAGAIHGNMVRCGEICYGIRGEEMSFVDRPAFKDALIQEMLPEVKRASVNPFELQKLAALLSMSGRHDLADDVMHVIPK